MLKKFIRDYLDFSARERAGVLLLSFVILILYAVPYITPHFREVPAIDKAGFEQEMAALMAAPPVREAVFTPVAATRLSPTLFDPNTLLLEGWQRMGVKERTAKSILKFVSKGGRFRQAEDLQKIYTLDKATYEQLLPYVRIAEKRDTVFRQPFVARIGPQPIDVNVADSAAWEQLPGVGPGFARRIVRFRERLGGFYFMEQVRETYGLPDSVFNKIQPFLRIGSISLRKIDINHIDEKSLAQHPYIDTKLAAQLIRYRSVHGPFGAVEDLKKLPLVDDIIYRKIENYITIN
ncbi:helix-hairpin-helix domain-containing protein [Chitinophaga horti]|uniref:Helix-hairpin-helix domain-containing protein n=1 Tax=Chitinophaga horti TaxID=2920382 RepID=A0ABY6J1B7_9BACT|nr:helix-hairpin-helix domain-containing protein [Chitinophaga horti]UYQ93310.1 helix-hairpin-helix domain-containing protein [Chitinophaga horti]